MCTNLCEVVEVLDHWGLWRFTWGRAGKRIGEQPFSGAARGRSTHTSWRCRPSAGRLRPHRSGVGSWTCSDLCRRRVVQAIKASMGYMYLPLGAQLVEHGEVGVGVIDVISIRRVLVPCPLVGCGHVWTCTRKVKKKWKLKKHRPISNMEFSGFDSSSTLSKPETCCRKRWRSGCELRRGVFTNGVEK